MKKYTRILHAKRKFATLFYASVNIYTCIHIYLCTYVYICKKNAYNPICTPFRLLSFIWLFVEFILSFYLHGISRPQLEPASSTKTRHYKAEGLVSICMCMVASLRFADVMPLNDNRDTIQFTRITNQ